jgi:hypothetical protein
MEATKQTLGRRSVLVLLVLGLLTAALASPGPAAAAGGDVLWTVPFAGTGIDDAVAVATGPSGSALLCGTLTPAATRNVVAIRASEAGAPDWIAPWGGSLSGGATTRAAAYDAAHQWLYLVAEIKDPVHSYAFEVIKVDATGSVAWTRTYSGRSTSVPRAEGAAVDAHGNLYVAGTTWYDEGAGPSEALLVKFSPQGALKWESAWWYGVGEISINGLAVSPSGVATCVGARFKPDMTLHSFARATATSGRRLWMKAFGGSGGSPWVSGVATAPQGATVAVGSRRRGDVTQGVAEKYSASGRLIWRRAVSTGSSGDGFLDVAVGRGGKVFVSGASALPDAAGPYVVALRSSGRVLWKSAWNQEGWGQRIVVTGTKVYVGGGLAPVGPAAPETIGVECLSAADGRAVWQRSYDLGADVPDAGVLDLAVVPGRSVYVAAGLNDAVTHEDGLFLRLAP